MKKATTLTILASLLLGNLTLAQDEPTETPEHENGKIAQNAVFGEVYGNAISLFSVNYERVFLNKKPFFLTARGGFGGGRTKTTWVAFPILINGLYQIKDSWFGEFGAGGTFYSQDGGPYYLWPTGILGVRRQEQKGLFGTLAWTPYYNLTDDYGVLFFVGATLGFAF